MKFVEFSPSAKSVQYECCYCEHKLRSPALSDTVASEVLQLVRENEALMKKMKWWDNSLKFDVANAKSYSTTQNPPNSRSPIPERVRNAVWRRDGGACVQCGSQKNLEYDHLIPHSKGGADTARNLQLLCQTCNRAKGAKI